MLSHHRLVTVSRHLLGDALAPASASSSVDEKVSPELMTAGKAAMCTRIATQPSEKHGVYGDIETGISYVELGDVAPGRVLRIHPSYDGRQNTMGIYPGVGKRPSDSGYNAFKGRPATQPRTELVHFSELAPDNVVIKVHASALNYPDLIMTTHVYQVRPDPPFCLGMEAAGEVIHVCGPESSYDEGRGILPRPRVGDRVFVKSPINTHSSRLAVPASNCTPIPDGMDYDSAAGFVQGIATSYNALVDRLRLKSGEWCIITGATGTIGLAGVQIAKKLGAKVIALGSDTRGTGRLDVVRRMGADHTIDYLRQPRWREQVKEITGGRGAECAYDVVGGEAFSECVRAVSSGGRICVGGFPGGIPSLPMNLVLIKALYVCAISTSFPENAEAVAQKRECLLSWANDASMFPHISHRFPLTRIQEALETMNERQHIGRIIIHPQEF